MSVSRVSLPFVVSPTVCDSVLPGLVSPSNCSTTHATLVAFGFELSITFSSIFLCTVLPQLRSCVIVSRDRVGPTRGDATLGGATLGDATRSTAIFGDGTQDVSCTGWGCPGTVKSVSYSGPVTDVGRKLAPTSGTGYFRDVTPACLPTTHLRPQYDIHRPQHCNCLATHPSQGLDTTRNVDNSLRINIIT